jgi:hypothetical protein
MTSGRGPGIRLPRPIEMGGAMEGLELFEYMQRCANTS